MRFIKSNLLVIRIVKVNVGLTLAYLNCQFDINLVSSLNHNQLLNGPVINSTIKVRKQIEKSHDVYKTFKESCSREQRGVRLNVGLYHTFEYSCAQKVHFDMTTTTTSLRLKLSYQRFLLFKCRHQTFSRRR